MSNETRALMLHLNAIEGDSGIPDTVPFFNPRDVSFKKESSYPLDSFFSLFFLGRGVLISIEQIVPCMRLLAERQKLDSTHKSMGQHFTIERPAGNAQFFSGFLPVPPTVIEGREDKLFFEPGRGIR